jgi:hypothetical protein
MEVAMAEPTIGSPLSMHDPRTVGPWTIHARLGAGGMGVVFHATRPGQAAAVKVIRPGLLDAPATRDRFRREVGILAAVRDVHICHYLDADLESEPAWLALEYLPGPVLRDRVASEGPLDDAAWWTLARGLAQALAVLELHRVTHRDLKPGNVILHERGPVLIDFGIAHPEDATSLTATGLVTGSPAWLSPEQANLEPTGPATDIFTLGSLLAYAATGRPPFGEGASVAVLMAIIKREPDLAGIDPVRSTLLRRMLAKDPAQRPTAREVLELARAGEAGEGVAALLGLPADISALPDALEPTLVDRAPGSPRAGPASTGPASTAPTVAGPAGAGLAAGSSAGTDAGGTTRPDGRPGMASPPDRSAPMPPPPVVRPASAPAAPHVTTPMTAPAAAPAAGAPATAPAAAPAAGAWTAPPPGGPVGPRTAAAAQRRRRRRGWLLGLAALLGVALLVLVGPSLLDGSTDPDGSGSGTNGSSQGGEVPPAPSSDQLRSGDWLLESYRLDNTDEGLVVSGTVRNRGTQTGSADLRVWVYLAGGESLGSVSGSVSDVPAGAAVPVTLRGDAVWKPGEKVVLLEATG